MIEDIFDGVAPDAPVVNDLSAFGDAADAGETPGTHARFSGFGWNDWSKQKR